MFVFSTLENTDIEILHRAFIEAFSDYQVKLDLPFSKFQQMLNRNGYMSKASIGTFNNDNLIGFLLNGIRNWNGKLTSYDTGTAVIEAYRKQGVTTNMFLQAKKCLKEIGVQEYLLEVIQSNEAAVELYKKQGFEITREFECFKLEKDKYNFTKSYKVKQFNKFDEMDWDKLKSFWDVNPSWQNSIDSIKAVSDKFIYSVAFYEDNIVGYGIIDKITGDIPQIAVDKNYRRKGIGKSIFSDLINSTKSGNIVILNVDSNCETLKNFLKVLGFKLYVNQYEMLLKL